MDNKKIGKLIADLRKQKGLTQQELGDIVGVGFRAVSKWERGLTLPDISIINELSKILGISSDELLNGEISKDKREKKKMSSKVKYLLITIFVLVISFAAFISYYNNKVYTYELDSVSEDYYVEGEVIFHKNNIQIIINKLIFHNQEFLSEKISNYEYQILSSDKMIFGYGNTENISELEKNKTVLEIIDDFQMNYNSNITISKNEIINNGLNFRFLFVTDSGEKRMNEMYLKLTNIKK